MHKWIPSQCTCPITYTLSVVGGKWKWIILYELYKHQVCRYGEMKRSLTPITHKMLTQQLKELESDQLIHRQEYQQVPPKVEYSLTSKGATLIPLLEAMSKWGRENHPLENVDSHL